MTVHTRQSSSSSSSTSTHKHTSPSNSLRGKTIALYSHSISPSIDGVCRRFTGILLELSRQGYDLILFTLEDKPQDLPPSVKCITLEHMIVPSYPEKKVARPSATSFIRALNALKKYRPALIHATSDGFSHMFTLLGLILGIPVLASFHTDLMDLLDAHNANLFQKMCVWTKERVDSIVLDSCATTSTSFAAKLKRQGISTEHIIITAVDTQTFRTDKKNQSLRDEMTFGDKNAFLCVYVGRISKEKRIDVIVEAVRSIEGVYLAIVGDGPSAQTYAALHGKENRIYCKPRFLTHSELAEVYSSSDLHVSASEFETLGNTVLEAFACKIPVVVPRTQGFLDTVNDSHDGFLFKPKDSSSARSFIMTLKNDSLLRKKMGQRGLDKVRTQSIENVANDLIEWYEHGLLRRQQRSVLNKLFCVLLCLVTFPLGIVALGCYDILMTLLLIVGYSPHAAMYGSATSPQEADNVKKQ